MLLDLLFRIVFRLFLIIMESTWITERFIYKYGEVGMKMFELGGTEILGVWVRAALKG